MILADVFTPNIWPLFRNLPEYYTTFGNEYQRLTCHAWSGVAVPDLSLKFPDVSQCMQMVVFAWVISIRLQPMLWEPLNSILAYR